ncbi:MAG: DMT family transporter [Gemmatimonadota bacterium]
MPPTRTLLLTTLTMAAFAGNSLLCRAALKGTSIDAASFTAIRLVSGAVALWLIVKATRSDGVGAGNWRSAIALFVYALAFSLAYVHLSTATGALLFFAAVQATMIGYGLWSGERMWWLQVMGLVLALGGLVGLLLPGLSAPPILDAALMLGAGVAWGVYSLRGKGPGNPVRVTAGNFLRAALIASTLGLLFLSRERPSMAAAGVGLAVASGALASGVGYAIWYRVLPSLRATTAASVQLSVPVIAALGGVMFLGESVTVRLVLASLAILGGIALVVLERRPMPPGRIRGASGSAS